MSTIPPSTPEYNWPIPLGGVRPNVRLALKDFGVAVEATVKAIQSTLNTVKAKADAAMPKSGGKFTGRIQVPNGTADDDALNRKQINDALATKANGPTDPRPGTWGVGVGNAVMVRGGLAGAPDDDGNSISVRWFPLPNTDSRFPGVVRWGIDTLDYGIMSIDRPSDPTVKTPLTKANPDFEAFLQTVGVHTFCYTEGAGARWEGTEHVGFMADEVAAAAKACGIPGVAETDAEGNGVAVDYDDMLAVAWAVIRDLTARVEALEAK